MFNRVLSPSFWQVVKVEYTDERGGRRTIEFDVQFRRMSMVAARTLAREFEGQDDGDLLFMREVVEDWKRVPDATNPVAFSQEALEDVYADGFGGPIIAHFFKALPKAKEKN